jgi:lipoyl(octanoyl) transferase
MICNSSTDAKQTLRCISLLDEPPLDYSAGLSLQQQLHSQRVAGTIPDTIIFLQHQSVISVGRRGEARDILWNQTQLRAAGVSVHHSDRGGQVTYHGPGQLIMYCIIHLGTKVRQVRAFVESLEQAVMAYIRQRYTLDPFLDPAHPGIWLPWGPSSGKVAAIGVSLQQRVSMHGLALNLSLDPAIFGMIVPCGISDRPVLSLSQLQASVDSPAAAATAIAPLLARGLAYSNLTWGDRRLLQVEHPSPGQ